MVGDGQVQYAAPARSPKPAAAGASTSKPAWARLLACLLVGLAYLIAACRLFHIVRRYAVNIFTGDQWDFNNATLFQQHSWWQVFRWQHGPHRQGLGAVLQKLLDPSIHWNTHYEAFGSAAVILIAALAALWLKARLFGGIDVFDIIIPLLFLTPAEFGILLFSANPAHGPLPLLLMVLYCLAWTVRSDRWKYALVLLVNFLMTYTGFGLFIGLVTPLLLAAEIFRDRRGLTSGQRMTRAGALLLSLASLASFFVGYKMTPAAACFTLRPANPIYYGWFISVMLADFVGVKGAGLAATLCGAVLAVALFLCLALAVKQLFSRQPECSRAVVISALSAYCLLFCVNAAYGRFCLGVETAQSSRYMIYLVPGFFAIYLYALGQQKWVVRGGILAGLLLVALLSSFHLNYGDRLLMQASSHNKRAWKDCYLARHDIEQCNALTNFTIYPFPQHLTQLQEKLDFLQRNRLNLFAK